MSEVSATAKVLQRIADTAAPLRELIELLDEEIAEKAAELEDLRDARKTGARMLRLADPTFEATTKPGPKKNGDPSKPVADEKLAAIRAFLEAHRAEWAEKGGVTASELTRHPDWNGLGSQATASAAMRILYANGVLRLDHMGTGGGKWYVLV